MMRRASARSQCHCQRAAHQRRSIVEQDRERCFLFMALFRVGLSGNVGFGKQARRFGALLRGRLINPLHQLAGRHAFELREKLLTLGSP